MLSLNGTLGGVCKTQRAQTSRLFIDFGLPPKMVRTPRCHRLKHKPPSELRQIMQAFPALWRHGEKKEAWNKLKNSIDQVAGTSMSTMPENLRLEAKKCSEDCLDSRCMSKLRIVENVTENHEALEQTMIIPGFKWCDFDHTPVLPSGTPVDKWDFYLTDFATDTYAPPRTYLDDKYSKANGKVQLPTGIWLRYHGLNSYALSSIFGDQSRDSK
jgi:hypothetical protein